MFVIAALLAFLLRYKYRGLMAVKIGIFLVLTYLCVWLNNGRTLNDGNLIASFILFVLAFLAWNLDKWRLFPLKRCGHGLWHILAGVAIAILFYVIHLLP